LPLALEQAAAYLVVTGMRAERYIELLQRNLAEALGVVMK
jgi:hypothetical protein